MITPLAESPALAGAPILKSGKKLKNRIVSFLRNFHTSHPLATGLPKEELKERSVEGWDDFEGNAQKGFIMEVSRITQTITDFSPDPLTGYLQWAIDTLIITNTTVPTIAIVLYCLFKYALAPT